MHAADYKEDKRKQITDADDIGARKEERNQSVVGILDMYH
jgi:hypothetical protein